MLIIDVTKAIHAEEGAKKLVLNANFKHAAITGIFGNSGQGKTTLFNIIAGIVKPDSGRVLFNDFNWFNADQGINVPIQKRKIAYIFQQNNLFPNFNIEENVGYALSKEKCNSKVIHDVLEELGLSSLAKKYPHELSGGQKQRAAIARALVQEAQLVLIDEPFTGLDLEHRINLIHLIKKLSLEHNLTVLIISHQVEELLQLCDEIFLLENHSLGKALTKDEFEKDIETKMNKHQRAL